MEERESKGGVEHDSWKTWHDTCVETKWSTCCHNVLESRRNCEALRIYTLHLCLDDVDWIVEHNRAESSKTAWEQINYDLVPKVGLKSFLCVGEDEETNALVGRLLQQGWNNALIQTSWSIFTSDSPDSLEHISVLRDILHLVMNQFCLERLLRCHDCKSFCWACYKPAEELISLGLFSEQVGWCEFESTESDGVFGHWKDKQSRVPAIETEKTTRFVCVLCTANSAESILLLIKLHDRFDVLSWVSARDFNRTDETALNLV